MRRLYGLSLMFFVPACPSEQLARLLPPCAFACRQSIADLATIVRELEAKGAALKALEQPIDMGSAAGTDSASGTF